MTPRVPVGSWLVWTAPLPLKIEVGGGRMYLPPNAEGAIGPLRFGCGEMKKEADFSTPPFMKGRERLRSK
jgi:hypothetical protein